MILGTQVNIRCVATCEEGFNFNSIKENLLSNAYSCHREIWNEKKGQENPFREYSYKNASKALSFSKSLFKNNYRKAPFNSVNIIKALSTFCFK